jgi:hypothetical protein
MVASAGSQEAADASGARNLSAHKIHCDRGWPATPSASSKRKEMQVDCSDARYELKIGDRVRRSLIRHFHAFIIKRIKSRGFDADDPRLFNQDMIEAEAWRLAAIVVEEAEREFRDDEFGAQIGILVPSSASEYLEEHLPNRAWLRLRRTI